MKRAGKYPFLKVGVTGGIGSGKSTVCNIFAGLGRFVISADQIARDIADTNPDVRKAIELEFGAGSYLPNATLDRKRMASIVFGDERRRAILNSIIHPFVFNEIDHCLETVSPDQSSPYLLVEAALIYEVGMDKSLDYVIVVTADEATRIQRVSLRDNIPPEDVRRRIAAQMSSSEKVDKADFVIHNDVPENELRSTIEFIDSLLTRFTSRNRL